MADSSRESCEEKGGGLSGIDPSNVEAVDLGGG